MGIENIDFYELFISEGCEDYSNLRYVQKELFNQFIRESIEELVTINSYDEVVPNKQIIGEIADLGYEHIHYQCHYSAKALTILNIDAKYYTGFLIRDTLSLSLVTHSFNLIDGKVVDFARIDDTDFSINNQAANFPHTYYGIELPREFVLKYKDVTIRDKSMNPLLYEWFLENIQ